MIAVPLATPNSGQTPCARLVFTTNAPTTLLRKSEAQMRQRRYVTAARVAELADTLTPREHAIVGTLDRVRLATTKQLERLHFAEGTPLANARQARRTLRKLVEAHVLSTLDRRVGGGNRGSSQAVYALDRAGQRLASAAGPAGGSRPPP